MNLKKLLPLAAILIVLLGINFALRMREGNPDIIQQADLKELVPGTLAVDEIKKIEIYSGSAPDQKLTLARKDGETWRVASHFDAPVRAEKMTEFLDKVTGLRGEYRAKTEGDAQSADYGLDEKDAFHVAGYDENDAAVLHLLVGKAPSASTVFMRQDGSNDVFVENENLRQLAGIYGEDTAKAPEATPWIDQTILDLDKEKIARIEFTMPDKRLVLERKAKEQPKPEAKEGEEAAAEAPKPEYEWVVAEGGPGVPLIQSGVETLLRQLDALNGANIADPAKKSELGMDAPAYRCVVTLEGSEEPVILEGAHPDAAGSGYVQVAGREDGFLHEVNKYTFEQIFPRGGVLFQLQKISVSADNIDKVEIAGGAQNIVLTKQDGTWRVDEPKADFEVQQTAITTLVSALAGLSPGDYADAASVPEVQDGRSVTFSGKDGKHTVLAGGASKHIEGAYVKLDQNALALAVGKMDLDRIFVAPKNLYALNLFEVSEQDIQSIAVTKGGAAYQLKRSGDGGWTLAADGAEMPADSERADDLALELAELQAQDLVFGETPEPAEAMAQIVFATGDGKDYTLTVEAADAAGGHRAHTSSTKQAFVLAAEDVEALTPPAGELKKPEPAPAETPAAPADEAASDKAPAPMVVDAAPAEEVSAPEGAAAPEAGTGE